MTREAEVRREMEQRERLARDLDECDGAAIRLATYLEIDPVEWAAQLRGTAASLRAELASMQKETEVRDGS